MHVDFNEPTLSSLVPSIGINFPVWTNHCNYPAEVCWAPSIKWLGFVTPPPPPPACLNSQMLARNCSLHCRPLPRGAWSLPRAGKILTLSLEPMVSVQFLSIQHLNRTNPMACAGCPSERQSGEPGQRLTSWEGSES